MALDLKETQAQAHDNLPVPAPDIAQHLHPAVYLTAGVMALIFILGAWSFAGAGQSFYLIAVVTGFIGLAVFLPYQLWRVRRHGHDPRDLSMSQRRLRDWLHADFDTWQARLSGRDAATAILLPVVAAAVSMIAFAIILHIDVG